MVFDSSAIIAWYEDELGADIVEAQLLRGNGMVSSINLTEIIGKLVGKGIVPANEVKADIFALQLEIVSFDTQMALEASFFYARRNPYNLSLGDCACLALAETRSLAVLTAEQSWAKIPNLRIPVKLIR